MKMKPAFLFFILLQFSMCSLTVSVTWTSSPSSPTGIQGQSVTITWTAELPSGAEFQNLKVMQVTSPSTENQVVLLDKAGGRTVYALYSSRDADVNLTVSENGTLVTSVFTLKNLNQSTDQHQYHLRVLYKTGPFAFDSQDSPNLQLTVLVPPTVTSPDPSPGSVTVNETQTAQLVCTATGNPAPIYNWTRDGVIVGTGSPFTTPAVTFNDDNACYTCIAYNGILDAKTANVCLNVQYQSRSTLSLESTKSTVCQNDTVILTCTSGPANPAPTSYEFYDDGVLVGTSVSNVYEAKAGVGLPAVNKFVCVPRNLLGSALENASVEVSAKVAPSIVTPPQSSASVVEESLLTLFCNASGVPAPNITWFKVGGSIVGNSETYTISSATRGDEGTYRCTASNGDECSNATAEANVVVNYKPEQTNMTHNKSNDVFVFGEPVSLTCESQANPSCHMLFYHGSQLLANKSSSTCTASHVISSIDGCNDESFSCFAMNEAGTGDRAYKNVTVQVPPGASVVPSSDNIVKVEGEALTLSCTPSGCPTPTVAWTKTGVSSPLEQGSGGVLNKTFASLSKQDTGTYQCNVNNGVVGSPAIKTIYLNVTYKPYLTNFTSPLSNACLNDQVTLQCTTDANPPVYEYRFYVNDVLVHTSMSGVYQVNVAHEGNNTYKCEPRNTVGKGQNRTVLVITRVPPTIVNTTSSQDVLEGSSHTLHCYAQAEDDEHMNVTWYKNGRGQVSSTGVYTLPSVKLTDSGSYECRARTGSGCEVKADPLTINVIASPNISNIIITEGSVTVTWGNLLLPLWTMATCWLNVIESLYGSNWLTSSKTSNGSSISCSISGLQPSTLYRIQYALRIHGNYANGTIYVVTSANEPSQSTCTGGVPAAFIGVIAFAVVIIVLLILVVIWMLFQDRQKNKRTNSKENEKTEIPLRTSDFLYENEGSLMREPKLDGDLALYEQVQNRDLARNQGVGIVPSFPMENIPGSPERFEREGRVTAADNQAQSKYEEPYQSEDARGVEAGQRFDDIQDSYGHLLGFTRRPGHNTTISTEDQNPYQDLLQSENRSDRDYQSLQKIQRPTFNI